MTGARIGVFGGTFDPIHIGHLAAAEDAAYALGLERVLFVPNRIPPHKSERHVSSVQDRLSMVRLAIHGNPLFELSKIELERDGPSYTLDTMRQLRTRCSPSCRLVFLTGCDAIAALHTWHQPAALLEEFTVVVLDRPTGTMLDWTKVERHFPRIREQVEVIHVAQLAISSSNLRERVRTGRPIRYYVAPGVEQYIREHRLYLV